MIAVFVIVAAILIFGFIGMGLSIMLDTRNDMDAIHKQKADRELHDFERILRRLLHNRDDYFW